MHDPKGDENQLAYSVDVESGEEILLTPFEKTRCQLLATSRHIPSQIVVGINDRDPRFHDLWKVDVLTGERSLIEENPGLTSYLFDDRLNLVMALRPVHDGSFEILRRHGKGEWDVWNVIPDEDARTTWMSHVNAAVDTLYMIDSRGRDTSALVAIDIATGQSSTLAADPQADLTHVLSDINSYEPVAYSAGAERLTYTALTDSARRDIDFLTASQIGDWTVISRTRDDRVWLITANSDVRPGIIYIYDRKEFALDVLLETRPGLADARLSRMHPFTISTPDGLSLVCYLTLPAAVDTSTDNGPSTSRPVPMVIDVHGGPAFRDRFGYNPNAQWLANRGYAVLQVNYRGSNGLGKAFLKAGDRQWGAAMSDDIDTAMDYVVGLGIADPAKVAITGGSYGGYAVLVALTPLCVRDRQRRPFEP